MRLLNRILAELRDSRLWPVAVALIGGLVAVPLLLAKSPSSVPVAPHGTAGLPVAGQPVVMVESGSDASRLNGRGRDPFTQPGSAASAPSSGAVAATTTTAASSGSGGGGTSSTSTTSAGSGGAGSGGAGGGAAPGTSTPGAPPEITPTQNPRPAPTGLTATQSYRVTLAITNSSGGVDTIDSLERLSPIPTAHRSLLVELGVLQGGRRVLFAVEPGTRLSGPGTCTPGPLDCEILSLAQNQTESLSMQSVSGPVSVALFAVAGIKADQHSSPSGASKARGMTAVTGRDILRSSNLGALSLFQYEPSLGALVDLRNLTVGGS